MSRVLLCPLLAPLLVTACAPEETPTELVVSIYGEEFIEEGIAADVFVDGWAVTFTRFLVSVGELSAGGEPFAEAQPFRVYDLAVGSGGAGFEVDRVTRDLAAYGDIGFVVGPSATSVAGNVDADDVTMMRDGGYSLFVSGSAKKGAESRAFAWGFTTRTVYDRCMSTATADGGEVRGQITIHGDHLFYDDLFSAEPNVAFDLIAVADDDEDGVVTEAELRGVNITTQDRYQVGDLTEIKDLWSFIEQQTTTLGHFDGEGHCEAVRE